MLQSAAAALLLLLTTAAGFSPDRVPQSRKLLKTGPSEVTLSWTPPAMPETVKSYQISVTCLLPSEDSAFMFEHSFQMEVAAEASSVSIDDASSFVLEEASSEAVSWSSVWKHSKKQDVHFGINVVRDPPDPVSPRMMFEPSFTSLDEIELIEAEAVAAPDVLNSSKVAYFEL